MADAPKRNWWRLFLRLWVVASLTWVVCNEWTLDAFNSWIYEPSRDTFNTGVFESDEDFRSSYSSYRRGKILDAAKWGLGPPLAILALGYALAWAFATAEWSRRFLRLWCVVAVPWFALGTWMVAEHFILWEPPTGCPTAPSPEQPTGPSKSGDRTDQSRGGIRADSSVCVEYYSLRRSSLILTTAFGYGPPLLLLALGWGLAWSLRGIRAEDP